MTDPIRAGIVGATVTTGGSGWGANAHVPALKSLPEYEVKAVCTAHEDTAEASRQAFGAELAFHDMAAMATHPEIDLVVVSVRVPLHFALSAIALEAGKPVFCEWPLGANLQEAVELARLARERSLPTAVGLQARSDPTVMFARELVGEGYIGEVLTASLSAVGQAVLERGPGRSWQGVRANGANTFTIQGGHAIDAMCFILGEVEEVTARMATRIPEWRDAETGGAIPVDAPDAITVAGRLASGAEVAIHIASVPWNPSGARLEIFGREGTLVVRPRGSMNIGPSQLFGSRGGGPLEEMAVPERLVVVPEDTPAGSPRNVAQAYVRFSEALRGRHGFDPDFEMAVTRHRLLDAIERSAAEGRSIKV